MDKQSNNAADERVTYLTEWLVDELRWIAWGADSISDVVHLDGIGTVRIEDKESAIWSAYLELLAAFPRRPAYGLDRELGIPSRRAVRRLARMRLRDRLIDQLRRHVAETHDPHVGTRANLVHLEAPCDDGAEPLTWHEKVGDPRTGVVRQTNARSTLSALGAQTEGVDEVIMLAPALGVEDHEIRLQTGLTRAAVRQRRSRLGRQLRRRMGEEH